PAPGSRSRAIANTSVSARSVSVFASATFIVKSVRASGRVFELRVPGSLELQRQLLVAALHHAAVRHYVYEIGHDVIQQPLIMRDHHYGPIRRTQRIDAVGGNPQRVNVEAGIHLIEDAQARLEQRHLQNFVSLLLAAGEADIYAA